MPRQRRRDHRATTVDGDDGVTQLAGVDPLGDVAGGAGGDGLKQRLGLLAGRHDQHTGFGQLLAQPGEQDGAAQTRHAHVGQHDVWTMLAAERKTFVTVGGLGHDVDTRVGLERGDETLAYEGEIIYDNDADLHGPALSLSRLRLLRRARVAGLPFRLRWWRLYQRRRAVHRFFSRFAASRRSFAIGVQQAAPGSSSFAHVRAPPDPVDFGPWRSVSFPKKSSAGCACSS